MRLVYKFGFEFLILVVGVVFVLRDFNIVVYFVSGYVFFRYFFVCRLV